MAGDISRKSHEATREQKISFLNKVLRMAEAVPEDIQNDKYGQRLVFRNSFLDEGCVMVIRIGDDGKANYFCDRWIGGGSGGLQGPYDGEQAFDFTKRYQNHDYEKFCESFHLENIVFDKTVPCKWNQKG